MMKVVGFFVLLCVLGSTDGMVCKIEKNQLTDSQTAAWRSYLEPIAKVIQLLNRAVVISSAKETSIADKSTVTRARHQMSEYMEKSMTPFRIVTTLLSAFDTKISDSFLLFNDDKLTPKQLRSLSGGTKRQAEEKLAEVESKLSDAITHAAAVPAEVAEVAAMKVTSDDNKILSECVEQFRMIVALIPHANRFASELSMRTQHLRHRCIKAFEFWHKALDANVTDRVDVKRFLICALFRVQQESIFMEKMTDIYDDFRKKLGRVVDSPNEKASVEAEARIKAIPQELTDAYNKHVDKKAEEVAKLLEESG